MATREQSLIQENLCKLYIRLNGYFTTGLILHGEKEYTTQGELDIIGIRFPFHSQAETGHDFDVKLSVPNMTDIIIAEVKSKGQQLQFNDCLTKRDLSGWVKILNWIGILDEAQITEVSQKLFNLTQPNQNLKILPQLIINSPLGYVSLRPIIFSPERQNINNASPFVNWTQINDYLWHCLCPEIGSRELCSTRYDFLLWGQDLSLIVKAYKNRQKSQVKFETIDELYLSMKKLI